MDKTIKYIRSLISEKLIALVAFSPSILIPLITIAISCLVIYFDDKLYRQADQNIEKSYTDIQNNIAVSNIYRALKLIEYKNSITEKMLQEKVKTRVDTAYSVAKNIYDEYKDSHTPEETQKMIIDTLRPLVWNNGDSFIFILDFDGVFKLAPQYLRHLEGSCVIDFRDATGTEVIREEINLIKTNGGGYLWDTFTRPGHDPKLQFKQLAYVKNFGHFNWYIGSAEYLDITAKETEKTTLEILRNVSGNGNGYFSVIDRSGNVILNTEDTTLEGTNISSLRSTDGKELMEEFLKSASSSEPYFVSYKWENPKTKMIEQKHIYLKDIPGSSLMIGSSINIDNDLIDRKKKEVYQLHQAQSQNIYLTLLSFVLFSLFIGYKISQLLNRKFKDHENTITRKSNELLQLNHSLENLVEERTDELNRAYENMKKIALTDALTGAYNRNYFNDALYHEIYIADRYRAVFSLLMFDIDHFKAVNDTFGHDVGDLVLVDMVNIVRAQLRDSDIFARVGGEEFMIILPQTLIDESYELAERIRERIQDHHFTTAGNVTISIGLVSYRRHETFKSILKRVDVALYSAKKSGRNQVAC